jgi:hypothetical protein
MFWILRKIEMKKILFFRIFVKNFKNLISKNVDKENCSYIVLLWKIKLCIYSSEEISSHSLAKIKILFLWFISMKQKSNQKSNQQQM